MMIVATSTKGGKLLTPKINHKDKVVMDVPVFIRSLEWAREDAPSDMALHRFTERATNKGLLKMKDYKKLIRK